MFRYNAIKPMLFTFVLTVSISTFLNVTNSGLTANEVSATNLPDSAENTKLKGLETTQLLQVKSKSQCARGPLPNCAALSRNGCVWQVVNGCNQGFWLHIDISGAGDETQYLPFNHTYPVNDCRIRNITYC